jgi:hypothetical protein
MQESGQTSLVLDCRKKRAKFHNQHDYEEISTAVVAAKKS